MAQGPIQMSREMAELLATRCDAITAGVVAVVQDFASDPIIRREMYRVIGVQLLIEGTYDDIGANQQAPHGERLMHKNSDFLNQLHEVGGQTVINLSHETRIRKLERDVRWLSLMVVTLTIAIIIVGSGR